MARPGGEPGASAGPLPDHCSSPRAGGTGQSHRGRGRGWLPHATALLSEKGAGLRGLAEIELQCENVRSQLAAEGKCPSPPSGIREVTRGSSAGRSLLNVWVSLCC